MQLTWLGGGPGGVTCSTQFFYRASRSVGILFMVKFPFKGGWWVLKVNLQLVFGFPKINWSSWEVMDSNDVQIGAVVSTMTGTTFGQGCDGSLITREWGSPGIYMERTRRQNSRSTRISFSSLSYNISYIVYIVIDHQHSGMWDVESFVWLTCRHFRIYHHGWFVKNPGPKKWFRWLETPNWGKFAKYCLTIQAQFMDFSRTCERMLRHSRDWLCGGLIRPLQREDAWGKSCCGWILRPTGGIKQFAHSLENQGPDLVIRMRCSIRTCLSGDIVRQIRACGRTQTNWSYTRFSGPAKRIETGAPPF